MARLPGVARGDAPEDIARVYDGATARFGKLLDPLVVTAHNPDVFRAYVGFEAAFAQARAVDERLKALAALKSAALIGCPFCVGQWVATGFVASYLLAPRPTRWVATVFAVKTGSDFLQYALAAAQRKATQP